MRKANHRQHHQDRQLSPNYYDFHQAAFARPHQVGTCQDRDGSDSSALRQAPRPINGMGKIGPEGLAINRNGKGVAQQQCPGDHAGHRVVANVTQIGESPARLVQLARQARIGMRRGEGYQTTDQETGLGPLARDGYDNAHGGENSATDHATNSHGKGRVRTKLATTHGSRVEHRHKHLASIGGRSWLIRCLPCLATRC